MPHDAVGTPFHTRQFRDSRGRNWRVYERQKDVLHRGPVTILVFECDAALRIVHGYPDDWHTLAPEALENLSWHL